LISLFTRADDAGDAGGPVKHDADVERTGSSDTIRHCRLEPSAVSTVWFQGWRARLRVGDPAGKHLAW